jgi:hypothetical protein
MGQPESSEGVALPVVWVGDDDLSVVAVNQFLVQVHQGEVFLTMGTLTPPVIIAETPDEMRAQAEQIGVVPVRTAGRFAFTPRRLRELIKVLQRGVEMHEAQEASGQ